MLSSALHRYSIQKPELGCYGHSENVRGVRNYGKRDAAELFDVYCFASVMQGEITNTGSCMIMINPLIIWLFIVLAVIWILRLALRKILGMSNTEGGSLLSMQCKLQNAVA